MTIQIISSRSTSVASLGQDRVEIRRTLGTYRTFRRTPLSEESDHFIEIGVIVTYSAAGVVTMMEFLEPARIACERVQLLGEPLDAVAALLATSGVEFEPDGLGGMIPSLSAGVYAPAGVIEGVQLGSDLTAWSPRTASPGGCTAAPRCGLGGAQRSSR
ncbi:hypothetical protein [Agromyces allii]|uniref:Uncharacterized protein n=1 Tax=Agromyces allii TaxID=393607 RepID=A0ABN2Q192_9MICO|nr:hypothetical protein [Agromyces allii]